MTLDSYLVCDERRTVFELGAGSWSEAIVPGRVLRVGDQFLSPSPAGWAMAIERALVPRWVNPAAPGVAEEISRLAARLVTFCGSSQIWLGTDAGDEVGDAIEFKGYTLADSRFWQSPSVVK